jgi:predicted esterase
MKSGGCGKAPTLLNSPATNTFNYNTITSGGASRRYILRLPEDYDNERPYRLILGFHGASQNAGFVAGNPAFFGLYALSSGSTIFVAPEAVDGLWSASEDTVFVDDILMQVQADLCIDTTRIELEGFSQGGAMVQTLACARPTLFRAAVVHSGGGLARPGSCEPIAYFGSLGLDENGGQETQTDFFAEASGCAIEMLPDPPAGAHLCSDYQDCAAGHPVRWCPYDGGHTPSPRDSGDDSSWMPEEVWTFLSQF